MAPTRTLICIALAVASSFYAPAQQTPTPVEIVRQPQDVTLEEGQTLTLNVEVSGTNPGFQWYRGTNKLTTSTTEEFTQANITTNTSGTYFVVVTNSVNVITSRMASVTVVRDVTPPILLSAEEYRSTPMFSSNRILLTFNELMAAFIPTNLSSSATNPLNYRVREFGTMSMITVTTAAVLGGSAVRLDLSSFNRTSLYLVTVTNLADVRSNRMTSPQFASVAFYITNSITAFDSIWAWDESGTDLGTAWRARDYNDSHWSRGRGIFAFEFDPINVCAGAKNTALSLGTTTYYFRFPFVVPRTSGKAILGWTEFIDDGAIIYLNGQQLRRVNMPAGTITATTPALTNREATCSSAGVTITNLLEGTNLLAVELHQAGTDFDAVFGLRLTATIQLPYAVPVALHIDRAPSGQLVLSWPGRQGLLKAGATPSGPWSSVATNSPVLLSPELSTSFFRLDPFNQ